jgi:hypothetical protein
MSMTMVNTLGSFEVEAGMKLAEYPGILIGSYSVVPISIRGLGCPPA